MTSTTLPVITPDFASGVFHAESASHPGQHYTLGVTTWHGAMRVSCNCPAGVRARCDVKPVPCRHAKAVVALLEAHGLAVQSEGRWVSTEKALVAA